MIPRRRRVYLDAPVYRPAHPALVLAIIIVALVLGFVIDAHCAGVRTFAAWSARYDTAHKEKAS